MSENKEVHHIIRVSEQIVDELLNSSDESDDELEPVAPEPPLVTSKPKIEVTFLAPHPIEAVVGVPEPPELESEDPEADAVNNLLSEIPESQKVDLLPSGLNAVELGYASIPVIILEKAKADLEEENQIGMGIYLSTPKTDKFSEDGENGWVRYGLSSMQGWRATMEGAHAAYPDLDASTSFFGVYDGHGGKVVAKFCAKYLHRQVLKNEAYAAGDIGTSVQKAFLRMDEMMCGQRGWRELAVLGDEINKFTDMIEGLIWSPSSSEGNFQADDWAFEEGPHSDFSGPTSGSTACVAIIRNNQLLVANAGDSRCVISRKGQAYNVSRDHKPDLQIEKERILKAGGFIHAGRVNGSLNLARAIGDMEFKQNKFFPAEKQIVTASPDISTVELCDDDEFMVLACDGIWDCMTGQQVVDFVHEQLISENKLSVVVERIFDQSLAPSTADIQGCDSMTMILVQFKKTVLPKESADSQESPTDESE